jgi:phosphatidate cytidylyltransferase
MTAETATTTKSGLSNLTQRIMVAVVAIPLVIYLVLFKPLALLGLAVILGLITVHEFYGLAKVKGFVPLTILGLTTAGAIILTFAHFRLGVTLPTTDLISVVLCVAVPLILAGELFRGFPNPLVHTSITLTGALYGGIGLGSLYGVREYFFESDALRQSLSALDLSLMAGSFVVTMLASIWICDTAAFGFGRMLGKNKIAPRVSPNKTYEGAIAGVLFAVLTWFAAWAWVPYLHSLTIRSCIVMGLITGVVGQLGDFAESQFKREVGVKDSSTLIPGHGGMLDRLDSILFVSPIAYVYLHLFGI